MGCCEACLKVILIITNVVIMLAGAVILVTGAIFYTKKFDFFPELENYSNNVNSVLIPMMVIGGVLLLVGMLGCCGACTGKTGLLNFYFIIVFLVVVLEIVVIVLGILKKDSFVKSTNEAATTLFEGYKARFVTKAETDAITDAEALAVNAAQLLFQCCGLTDGASYWKTTSNSDVPPGCCSDWNGEDVPPSGLTTCDADKQFSTGCTETVNALADEFGIAVIIVIVAVILFEVLCLVAACISKKKDLVV